MASEEQIRRLVEMLEKKDKSSEEDLQLAMALKQLAMTRDYMPLTNYAPPPQAFSMDGKTFGYEAQVDLAPPVGAYVIIEYRDKQYLGQITTKEIATRDGPEIRAMRNPTKPPFGIPSDPYQTNPIPPYELVDRLRLRYVQGTGEILGQVIDQEIEPTTSYNVFDNAKLSLAPNNIIASRLSVGGKAKNPPTLNIGYSFPQEAGNARVHLQPTGFRRHTFMCGQSRSGKTFALGVILEQILLSENAPRIVILDPNSDFVRLKEIRSKPEYDAIRRTPSSTDEYTAMADRYAQISPTIHILRPFDGSLRVRLKDLNRHEQGAVLQLHPIHDLQAFNTFSKVIEILDKSEKLYSWQVVNNEIIQNLSGSMIDLALRIQNLGVAAWGVWCQTEEPSIANELKKDDWRCMVIDIGTLASAEERTVTSLAVLNYLWDTKSREKPVLLVLDEAHNICPHEPSNQMEQIATDYIIRIAGEGLKYGLRLLLTSQRPAKIHASVLSQCENLVLMRMNSQADLENLTYMFSQVQPTLIAQSHHFVQGQSLIIGEIVKSPTFAKFEGRITHEGGSDAPIK